MWAAAENHADAIRVLAEAGADINARSTVLDAPVLEFPRSGGPNSPLPRGGWTALMFAARDGAIDGARARRSRRQPERVALPQTDIPLKPEEIKPRSRRASARRRWSSRSSTSHYDLAAMLLEKGADPNVVDGAGMGALYAAVDMNSLQWVQGRPAPILTDKLDGVDLVKLLLAKGANPNARLKAAAQASSRRRLDAELRRGNDAADSRGADQRRRRDEGAARWRRRSVPDAARSHQRADDRGRSGLRRHPRRGHPHRRADAGGRDRSDELLLDRGMDVDAFNNAGNTALARRGRRGDAVVKFLASRGASLNLKNKAGFTPLDVARARPAAAVAAAAVSFEESTAALLAS